MLGIFRCFATFVVHTPTSQALPPSQHPLYHEYACDGAPQLLPPAGAHLWFCWLPTLPQGKRPVLHGAPSGASSALYLLSRPCPDSAILSTLQYAMLCCTTPRHIKPCYAHFRRTHLRRTLALQGAPWCYTNPAWTLNGDYLIQWGGRWGPFMKSQPHRWALSCLKCTMKLSVAHSEEGVLTLEKLGEGQTQAQSCPLSSIAP